jgi:N-acetylmuramoyl-L-alanine amidase
MPSVLVECGFVTNKREADFLNATYGQEIIASAIFRAFRGTLETNYPDIAFRRTTQSTDNSASSGNGFGIQIASSKAPIATDDSYFKKAKLTIERKELNTTSAYKYIYIAGRFASKEEANEALSQIRKRGFKDAFVVTL